MKRTEDGKQIVTAVSLFNDYEKATIELFAYLTKQLTYKADGALNTRAGAARKAAGIEYPFGLSDQERAEKDLIVADKIKKGLITLRKKARAGESVKVPLVIHYSGFCELIFNF